MASALDKSAGAIVVDGHGGSRRLGRRRLRGFFPTRTERGGGENGLGFVLRRGEGHLTTRQVRQRLVVEHRAA